MFPGAQRRRSRMPQSLLCTATIVLLACASSTVAAARGHKREDSPKATVVGKASPKPSRSVPIDFHDELVAPTDSMAVSVELQHVRTLRSRLSQTLKYTSAKSHDTAELAQYWMKEATRHLIRIALKLRAILIAIATGAFRVFLFPGGHNFQAKALVPSRARARSEPAYTPDHVPAGPQGMAGLKGIASGPGTTGPGPALASWGLPARRDQPEGEQGGPGGRGAQPLPEDKIQASAGGYGRRHGQEGPASEEKKDNSVVAVAMEGNDAGGAPAAAAAAVAAAAQGAGPVALLQSSQGHGGGTEARQPSAGLRWLGAAAVAAVAGVLLLVSRRARGDRGTVAAGGADLSWRDKRGGHGSGDEGWRRGRARTRSLSPPPDHGGRAARRPSHSSCAVCPPDTADLE